MDDIDLRLLRIFAAIHAARHVTRAAEALDLSQPTVSLALGRLRRRFGDPLFVRSGRGVAPTPRAEALIGPVRDLLRDLARISQSRDDFAPASARRAFRIAMTDASHVTLLPKLLAHVRRDAPGVTLEAARISADLPMAMEQGAIDLAIGLIPQLEHGFHRQTLYMQDWVCLAHRRHPRIRNGLSLAEWRREAHVEIVGGTGQQLLETALADSDAPRRVALRLPGFLGLAAIIGATDLIATLPRQIGETLAEGAGLSVHPCPIAVPRFAVTQHWHPRVHHDAANLWLRGCAARLFLARQPRTGRTKRR